MDLWWQQEHFFTFDMFNQKQLRHFIRITRGTLLPTAGTPDSAVVELPSISFLGLRFFYLGTNKTLVLR